MDQGNGSISSSNPRVDPSDWASRRKQAMSRARELRSRIKESDSSSNNNIHSDVSSLASSSKSHIKIQKQAMAKSEIQRQRRSRQLEATQKLLDGGFDFIEQSSTYPSTQAVGSSSRSSSSHQTSDRHETTRVERYNHDEQPVGKRSGSSTHTQHNNETSHSIISQKQLGQIHRRYQTPSTTESSNSSTMKLAYHDAEKKYSTKEEEYNDEIVDSSSKSKFKSTFNEHEDNMIQRSVREEIPQLTGSRGRGRGRGRSRPSGSGGTSSLGELSRSRSSNKSLLHALSSAGERKHESQADSRSHSPSNTRSNNVSRKDNVNKDFEKEQAIQSYLKSRQVPDYKEGECEKLAILRQRLVARRQKRQNALQLDGGNGDKGTQPASSSVQKPVNSHLKEKDNSHSLERLDPNDFTAKDFQTSSSKSSKRAISSSPPRVQMQHDVRDDDIHEPATPSMDRSHMSSSTRRSKMHADIDDDDEASVVDIQLVQCDCCKRSFAPKIYEKHFDSDGQPKCASVMDKKRPVFNSAKVRIFVHMMCLSLT